MAIPASDLVQITPRVLSGTGTGLNFNGLFLTENQALPSGQLMPFYSAAQVADYFGAGSDEYQVASTYFNGFDNSQTKPQLVYFFRHDASAAPAFVRSGAFNETQAQALAALNNITAGTFTATVNGNTATVQNIDFSGVTSLSAAAAILQGAIRGADVQDDPAKNQYATAIAAGPAGNDLSITIEQGAPEIVTPAVAASCALGTAKTAGAAGNDLAVNVTAGTPDVTPAVAASSAIGTAKTAGAAGNNITVTVTGSEEEVTAAVAASCKYGTAKDAGAAGNEISVAITDTQVETTAAVAASCKYGTAKTAGAAGNSLKVVVSGTSGNWNIAINNGTEDVYTKTGYTEAATVPADLENDYIEFSADVTLAAETVQLEGGADAVTEAGYKVVINNGESEVFSQEVTSDKTTSDLTENNYITWADSQALSAETVQLQGGADMVSKTVYDVVTALNGEQQDAQNDLESPAQLVDNDLVVFNKELAAFSDETYSFTGGADEVSVPRYNVAIMQTGEQVWAQSDVLNASELGDNDFIAWQAGAVLAVQDYPLAGGADAVTTLTYIVQTSQAGTVVDRQEGIKTSDDLQPNDCVTFSRDVPLLPGIYPLTGGRDNGAAAWQGATVNYASNLQAFTLTLGSVGAANSIADCAGSAAEAFYLTPAQGAVYSEGADERTLTDTMNAVVEAGQNWFSFAAIRHLSTAEAIELAQWTNARYNEGTQFLFVLWDDDEAMLSTTTQGETTAAQLNELNVNGTAIIYDSPRYAGFLMGAIASVDWNGNNSTVTFAFKSQSGLPANVQSESAAVALENIRVNFIGNYASRNDAFILLQHGEMIGQWHWIDSYVNATWLTSELQVQILAGLESARRVPYTVAGYTLIRSWCQSVIERAITNGVISAGVNLSQAQKTEIQQEAGLDISNDLYNNGFYLQIQDADATVRQQRESPTMALWYTDAGSVHRISMPVTTVQ